MTKFALRSGARSRSVSAISRASALEVDFRAAKVGAADLGEVQHVVDQLAHALRRAADAVRVLTARLVELLRVVLLQDPW